MLESSHLMQMHVFKSKIETFCGFSGRNNFAAVYRNE